jgi:hypothetical protein
MNVLALVRAMLHTSPGREESLVDQEQQSRWRPTRRQLLWASGIVAVLTGAVLIGYRYDITLWDWIKLLIVPAVIAGGGIWFNAQQREREQQIANERAQDEALQAYLDQMSGMLIPPSKDLPSLYKARPGDSLSSVARARTLTVLPRLDAYRKARVVQFLYEAGLIRKRTPVISLDMADLSGAYMSIPHVATLLEAHLSGAFLSGAILWGMTMYEADLSHAKGISDEQLERAESLKGATMPNGQKYEDWLKDREKRQQDK